MVGIEALKTKFDDSKTHAIRVRYIRRVVSYSAVELTDRSCWAK